MTTEAASLPAGIPESPRAPPRWTFISDLRAGAIALIPVAGAISWAGWSGNAFAAFGLVGLGFVCATPVLLVVLMLCSLSSRPALEFIRRVAAQCVVVLVMSLPILFLGDWFEGLSIRTSQHRGDRIVTALEAFRRAHGTCPVSLAALEKHARIELPQPTTCSDFMYELDKDGQGYSLSFSGGGIFRRPWFRDSGSQVWRRLD